MIKYIVTFILLITTLNSMGLPSTYYKIKDTNAAKEYFFTYMSKIAYTQNQYILDDRAFMKRFFNKRNITTKVNKDHKRFTKILKRYKLNTNDTLSKYLLHIDTIPVSLVLAQAAIESGWGKSRFIREGNNVFGQWTWSGKGLVPKSRDVDKKHRIKIFASIDSAVRGYMLNLNISWAYKDLRTLRANLRKNKKIVSGSSLATTLINYSQKKEEYTKLLDIIIARNSLKRFDK